MPEWVTILLVVMGGTAGTGGLWGGVRWLVGWSERRSEVRHARDLELLKTKHDYEAAIMTRVEKMQDKYLALVNDVQTLLTAERKARLEQALEHAQQLAATTNRLLEATERMAPLSQ